MDKLFLFDKIENREISYSSLINDINDTKVISNILLEKSIYDIFRSIIVSLVYDEPITLIDSDVRKNEVENFDIIEKAPKNIEIKNRIIINSIEDLYILIKGVKRWKITLFTSGTTGIPKRVIHNFGAIIKNVIINESKSDNIWGFAFNPTHIAGLQVFFQAFLNQNSIINIFGLQRNTIFELIDKFRITNISATPTFYRLLLPYDKEYNSVTRVTSGGEKITLKLFDDLKKVFPFARMLNVYASTEAGTIFSSENNEFYIKEKYHDRIKVEDNEILIHKSILGFSEDLKLDRNWYHTGDIIEIISQNPLRFVFSHRKSEMINVGGYKVNPNEVEEVLENNPDIREAFVYGKPNSLLGNILICDIIKKKANLSEKMVLDYLREQLQPHKIPRIINFVETISQTRTGKIKRL